MDPMREERRRRRQGVAGFVLVELMLVVAVIGILAAVALPNYGNYLTRSRVVEALELGMTAQKAVTEFHDRWGVMPGSNAEAGLPEAGKLKGRYVDAIEVLPGGLLLIRLNASIVQTPNPKSTEPAPPYQLVMRPAVLPGAISAPVVWVCQAGPVPPRAQVAELPAAATHLIKAAHLPSSCRGKA